MVSKDDRLVYHILRDWRRANLSEGDRAMLEYAEKLTLTPGQVNAEDVEALRAVGLDERNILDVVLITAKFAFMTRLADGLGVEPAEGRQEWVEEWLTGPAREQEWLMNPKQ